MTTETVEREIEVLSPKMSELIFEIVGDEWRTTPRTAFIEDEITEALTSGKTLKINGNEADGKITLPRLDKYVRWATANQRTLHRKTFPRFVIVWSTENKA